MATAKRRLLVTLDADMDVVLRRLSRLRSKSQSGIIRELLQAALPQLEVIADHLEQVERMDPATLIASFSAQAHGQIAEATQRALPLVAKRRRKRASG
jgi:hypothetical protein